MPICCCVVSTHRVPQCRVINRVVAVASAVTHACNELPGHCGVALTQIRWKAFHGLAEDFHHALERQPLVPVGQDCRQLILRAELLCSKRVVVDLAQGYFRVMLAVYRRAADLAALRLAPGQPGVCLSGFVSCLLA
jgi:hypothetical protein